MPRGRRYNEEDRTLPVECHTSNATRLPHRKSSLVEVYEGDPPVSRLQNALTDQIECRERARDYRVASRKGSRCTDRQFESPGGHTHLHGTAEITGTC
jgi:hypothetical protein